MVRLGKVRNFYDVYENLANKKLIEMIFQTSLINTKRDTADNRQIEVIKRANHLIYFIKNIKFFANRQSQNIQIIARKLRKMTLH